MISFKWPITVDYPMYTYNNYFKGSFSKFIEWLTTDIISMHFLRMLYDDMSLAGVYDLYDKKAIVMSHNPFYISSSEYWYNHIIKFINDITFFYVKRFVSLNLLSYNSNKFLTNYYCDTIPKKWLIYRFYKKSDVGC